MRTHLRRFRPAFAPALLLCGPLLAGAAPPPQAPLPSAAAAKTVLRDRVLAVVDEDPILDSDVARIVKLNLLERNPGEADEAYRRRVLNGLIDQRLQFHEIDRFGFEQVPVDQIEKGVAQIRSRYPDDAAFRKALREVGLDPKQLRLLVARQLLVLTYVDERLGPRVFVGLDDITRYYRDVLTPEMLKRGQQPPPLEELREDIRETLKQQKLTQETARWTRELRDKADVVVYPEQPAGGPLPPVVKVLTGKKGEGKKP